MKSLVKYKKKKKIYLIFVIIIGVLLIADTAAFFLLGKSNINTPYVNASGSGQSGFSFDMSNLPEGFDSGNLPEGFDSGNLPEGFNSGNMPSGFGGNGNMPGNFNSANLPNSGMNPIRLTCIIVGVLLLILEVVFILLFVNANKKVKKLVAGESLIEVEEIVDPVELRKQKQRRDRIVMVIVLLLLAMTVVALVRLGKKADSNEGSLSVEESVKEVSADAGEISQSVKGTGVVSATAESDLTIPGSITIVKYYVENGELVEVGDVIASVDMNSVKAAIGDIQSLIDELDEEMMKVKEDSVNAEVTAPASGRVVKIYAEEGLDVVDTMYDNNTLAIISLDGLLAVDIPSGASYLTVDAKVVVLDSDGNEYEGLVTDVEKDKVVVKVSMDDFTFGENVTVKKTSGSDPYASGELYVSNRLNITGYSGTVDTIEVSENDVISKGDTLIVLSNTDYTAKYMSLLEKRINLVEQYNKLVEISNTGYVYANAAGTVSNLNTSATAAAVDSNWNVAENGISTMSLLTVDADVTGSISSSSGNEVTGETVSKTISILWLDENGNLSDINIPEKVTVILLKNEEILDTIELSEENGWEYSWTNLPKYDESGIIRYTVEEADLGGYEISYKSYDTVTLYMNTSLSEAPSETDRPATEQPGTDAPITDAPITDAPITDAPITEAPSTEAPSTEVPVTEAPSTDAPTTEVPGTERPGTDEPGGEQPGDNRPGNNEPTTEGPTTDQPGTDGPSGGQPSGGRPSGEQPSGNQSSGGLPSGGQPSGEQPSGELPSGEQPSGNQSSGGLPSGELPSGELPSGSFPGGNAGDNSGNDGNGSIPAGSGEYGEGTSNLPSVIETEKNYDVSETSICSITLNDQVHLKVTIDELDINNVHVGQTCEVTLDAIIGQLFTGTITRCNPNGENNGGNTKYTVTIELDKTENMLIGMNASVSIPVQTKEDILVIPEDAIVEKDGHEYVYTSYNKEKDELSGLTEITTGASDGSNVEIVEGLTYGDTVYYKYADTIQVSYGR